MLVQRQISDTAQVLQRGLDQKWRCSFQPPRFPFSHCEAHVRRYDFVTDVEDHQSDLCRIVSDQSRFAQRRCRKSSPSKIGLPSRSSPRLRRQDARRTPSRRLRRDSLRSSLRRERRLEARDYAPASASKVCPDCSILPPRPSGFGGKGIRTPDFQLAKLALYQLSYAPARIAECRFSIFDCKGINTNCRMPPKRVDIRHALFLWSVLL